MKPSLPGHLNIVIPGAVKRRSSRGVAENLDFSLILNLDPGSSPG